MMLIFIDLTQAAQPGRDLQTAPFPHHTGGGGYTGGMGVVFLGVAFFFSFLLVASLDLQ